MSIKSPQALADAAAAIEVTRPLGYTGTAR
jgi:hypothetical protein